jgi:hypothetical protein
MSTSHITLRLHYKDQSVNAVNKNNCRLLGGSYDGCFARWGFGIMRVKNTSNTGWEGEQGDMIMYYEIDK